jgi:CheY-like chemotaxis protein
METSQPSKTTIVLVDDDKFLVDMYGMKFTKEGYAVHAFLSVDDALGALRQGLHPDAILFDIVMPIHDGFFLLDTVQKEKLAEGAVCIALTNQSDDAERQRALALGAHQYLIKASMIPSEVVTQVATCIAQKH